MTLLGALVSVGAGLSALSANAQPSRINPEEIRAAFIESTDLTVARSKDEIPEDVYASLGSVWGIRGLAEWGDPWSSSDLVSEDLPLAQHVFSAISARLVAIIYRTGGWNLRTSLLLNERGQRSFCVLNLGRDVPSSIDRIQFIARESKDSDWRCSADEQQ